ncbi:unnamed protein product [Ectocarpus sp. CCAP 1310/34]|nr:unnamed protein product [Ectocarpus sp. CCAP 1310/34]
MLRRDIKIAGEARVIKHRWSTHARGYQLTSTLLKKGTETAATKAIGSVVDDLEGVVHMAREHVDDVRERATKRRKKKREGAATRSAAAAAVAASAAERGPRLGADTRLARSDPLEALLFSGPRRSPQPTTTPPRQRQTAIDRHRDGVKQSVLEDDVLKEELRELLCVGELGEAAATKAAVDAENIRALVASIETLKLHSHSNIGRAAYNTVIAAAAGAEHTCDPDDPCTPDEPCAPAEPQGAEALEKGRYLWAPRKERSDKMDERVMGLARRFWHTAVLSYTLVGTKAMWRPSKKAGEEYHSRRQLMVAGDQVWRKFLKWPEYLGLKAELLREDSSFADPGRTLFLSTRCGCLGG